MRQTDDAAYLITTETQIRTILKAEGVEEPFATRLAQRFAASLTDIDSVLTKAEQSISSHLCDGLSHTVPGRIGRRFAKVLKRERSNPFQSIDSVSPRIDSELQNQLAGDHNHADRSVDKYIRGLLAANFAAESDKLNSPVRLRPAWRVI